MAAEFDLSMELWKLANVVTAFAVAQGLHLPMRLAKISPDFRLHRSESNAGSRLCPSSLLPLTVSPFTNAGNSRAQLGQPRTYGARLPMAGTELSGCSPPWEPSVFWRPIYSVRRRVSRDDARGGSHCP